MGTDQFDSIDTTHFAPMLQLVHFDFFCYKMRWQRRRILHQKELMQNALIWYISTHFVTKYIDAFSIDLVYIEAKSNSKKTKPFSIRATTHNAA